MSFEDIDLNRINTVCGKMNLEEYLTRNNIEPDIIKKLLQTKRSDEKITKLKKLFQRYDENKEHYDEKAFENLFAIASGIVWDHGH